MLKHLLGSALTREAQCRCEDTFPFLCRLDHPRDIRVAIPQPLNAVDNRIYAVGGEDEVAMHTVNGGACWHSSLGSYKTLGNSSATEDATAPWRIPQWI